MKEAISSHGKNLVFVNDYLIRVTVHYTDCFATDIVYFINQVEKQLQEEKFQKEHTWYLGFHKNGVVYTEHKEELSEVKSEKYRALYSYVLENVEKYGFKEPKITVTRLSSN